MNLDELYKIAKNHKDTHKHCGAEPYLDYQYLYNFLKKESTILSNEAIKGEEGDDEEYCILELGSGIGFTACVMNLACKGSLIDSIENNPEHIQIAKTLVLSVPKDLGDQRYPVINYIQADVYKILPYLETKKYNFIFFDVYGPKEKFLVDFERILMVGGILYSVNSHLKSAEESYFRYLENSPNWKVLDKFNDTKIFRKTA